MSFSAMRFAMGDGEWEEPLRYYATSLLVSVTNLTGRRVEFGRIVSYGTGNLTVSWGDGNTNTYEPYNDDGTYVYRNVYHEYYSVGSYVITLSDSIRSIVIRPTVGQQSRSIWGSDYYPVPEVFRTILSIAPHLDELASGCADGLTLLDIKKGGTLYFRYGSVDGVALGDRCFAGCTGLSTLEGVARFASSAGDECFMGCSSLRDLYGSEAFSPNSARCFSGCSSLKDLTGLCPVTSLGAGMFELCTGLTSLSGLPSVVSSFGEGCFAECTSLASLSAIVSSSVSDLPARCFYGCSSLTSVDDLTYKIRSFGDECFRGTSLRRLFVDDYMNVEIATSFGARCFMDTPLEILNLDGSSSSHLTSIGDECFRGCYKLRRNYFHFGFNLTTLGEGVFRDCYKRTVDEYGIVESEVGINGDLQFMQILHNISEVPSYMFFGDALITSLNGLANGLWGGDKTRLGHYCFSGCTSLKNLSGLAQISTSASEDSRKVPSYPHSNLGEGVFSGLFCPPYELKSDPVDPILHKRKKRYRGLVDASGLTGMNSVTVYPASTFEGCALLPDFPVMGNKAWWWGDRCFAGCCNMETLDSIASIPVDKDDIHIVNAYISPKLPRFGAYCFADCSWDSRPEEDMPNPNDMVFELDPDNPPDIHSGLTKIGGIRKLVDRMEFESLKKIVDLPSYLVERWARLLGSVIVEPAQLSLGEETGSDYYKFLSISEMLSFSMWGDRPVNPLSGIQWAVEDGVFGSSGDDWNVMGSSGSSDIAVFVRPLIEGDGGITGVVLDVGMFHSKWGSSDRDEIATGIEIAFIDDKGEREEIASSDNGAKLCLQGTLNSGEKTVVAVKSGDRIAVGMKFTVLAEKDGADYVACEYEFDSEIEVGGFAGVSDPIEGYKRMLDGFLKYAMCAYNDYTNSWIGRRWVHVDQFVPVLEGIARNADIAAMFKRKLSELAIANQSNALGPHCFDGCTKLSVGRPASLEHNRYDGFPQLFTSIPAYCFRKTSVSPSDQFAYVKQIGEYAFSETGTRNLSEFPPFVTYIPPGCFSLCVHLTELGSLRNGIADIGSRAFDGCSSLSDILFKAMSITDIDGSSDLGYVASPGYTEYVDKYGYACLAKSIGSFAFKGSMIESLAYEWYTFTVVEGEEQAFAADVFGGLFDIEVEAIDRTDGSRTNREFMFRMKTGGWGSPEIVFRGEADISDVNSPGFDMNGNALEGGCVKSIRFIDAIEEDYWWYPPYTGRTVPDGIRQRCAPFARDFTGYLDFRNCKVRVFCPSIWFSSRDGGSSVNQCDGDVLNMIIGPYFVKFQVCLSAELTEQGSTVTGIKYELTGVKCVYVSRIDGSTGLDRVPLFPLLTSVGMGCFEGCTRLKGLEGLEGLHNLPSRCFAGCPFEHDVGEPEVITPAVTVGMPVLDDRRRWQRNVISAVYLYRDSHMSGGLVDSVNVYTKDYSTSKITISVAHTPDGRVYTPVSTKTSPVTYQGVTYTPTFVSIDDSKIVIALSDELKVRISTEWKEDGSYVAFGSAEKYDDTVENEMEVYMSALVGSVGEGSGCDFSYVADGLETEDGGQVPSLIDFSWSRDTGEWDIRYMFTRFIVSSDTSKSFIGVGGEDGTLAFSCVEHNEDGWEVELRYTVEAVKVISRSVTILPGVSSIGNDCFTFDKYPDVPKLEAVYFDGRSAASVRAMNGFPFGVPPGCAIYANGGIIYTEPLPPSK